MSALAWAGLVFVIAVPSAEVVRSKLMPAATAQAGSVAPVVQPVKAKPVATVAPAVKPVATPAPTTVATTAASGSGAPADPIKDYLADGKPLPDYITTGKASAPAAAASSQPTPAPLPRSAASASTAAGTVKPAAAQPKPTVTEADLKDWKSGTLEDYLRQHGLLTEAAPAAAGN